MGKGVLDKDSGLLAGFADTLATLAGGNILADIGASVTPATFK